MSQSTAPTQNITALAPQTPEAFPAWFATAQQEAWQAYLDAPMPTRRDETWRFGNLKQLDFEMFTEASTEDVQLTIPNLPEGVICLPLEEALQQHSELVQEHFMKNETKFITLKFTLLNYTNVSKNNYQYMLSGFDNVWINGRTNNHCSYTNLSQGEYVFKVKGSNGDNVFSNIASVRIIVYRPSKMTNQIYLGM